MSWSCKYGGIIHRRPTTPSLNQTATYTPRGFPHARSISPEPAASAGLMSHRRGGGVQDPQSCTLKRLPRPLFRSRSAGQNSPCSSRTTTRGQVLRREMARVMNRHRGCQGRDQDNWLLVDARRRSSRARMFFHQFNGRRQCKAEMMNLSAATNADGGGQPRVQQTAPEGLRVRRAGRVSGALDGECRHRLGYLALSDNDQRQRWCWKEGRRADRDDRRQTPVNQHPNVLGRAPKSLHRPLSGDPGQVLTGSRRKVSTRVILLSHSGYPTAPRHFAGRTPKASTSSSAGTRTRCSVTWRGAAGPYPDDDEKRRADRHRLRLTASISARWN